MDLLKLEKAAIDSDPNLSPWEKLARKLMANEQIADLIDREAECRCDRVDFGYECMRELVRHSSFNSQGEQYLLNWLYNAVESRKNQIQQQAEYAKRQRDEQIRVRSRRLLSPF